MCRFNFVNVCKKRNHGEIVNITDNNMSHLFSGEFIMSKMFRLVLSGAGLIQLLHV